MVHGMIFEDDSSMQNFTFVQKAQQENFLENFGKGHLLAFYGRQWVEYPYDTFAFLLTKARMAWLTSLGAQYDRALIGIQIPYLLLGIYGIILSIKRSIFETALFVGVVFYFWAVTVTVLPTLRYMMPAMVLMTLFAAIGWENVWNKIRKQSQE